MGFLQRRGRMGVKDLDSTEECDALLPQQQFDNYHHHSSTWPSESRVVVAAQFPRYAKDYELEVLGTKIYYRFESVVCAVMVFQLYHTIKFVIMTAYFGNRTLSFFCSGSWPLFT
eukprot:1839393-Rhodomonas_salina.2